MKFITATTLSLAAFAAMAVFNSCKKEDSVTSLSPADPGEGTCQPVVFSSRQAASDYIVILNETSGRLSKDAGYLQLEINSMLEDNNITAGRLRSTLQGDVNGFVARLTKAEAAQLAANDDVKFVEPDRIISLGTPCFTLVAPSTAQWGVRRTGVGDGTGKTVWVIDTGVDLDHPDLNTDKTRSRNFINTQAMATDDNGHGTHVAGIIAALNNNIGVLGVASGAKVVALKVLNNVGEGNTSYIFQALNYIGQQAAAGDVVNMSLGADTISNALDNTVKQLAAKGILFSIAAGNDRKAANLSSPARANHPNIYTVSAIDSLGRFASFSNYGNDVVDYAAPGVNIVSTYSNGRYARLSGTSMAAPHVAGILLLNGNAVKRKGNATNDPDGTPDPIASVN